MLLFNDFNTVCSLVLITSCTLNPIFLLRLHDSSILQSIITFNTKSIGKNLLFGCFFGLSTNLYLCFLYTGSYLLVMTGKFLRPNFSSICFSFNHNLPIPSTITSMPLFSYVFFANIHHFMHAQKIIIIIFVCVNCPGIFGCFSLNVLF